jgi:hypothetical protein
MGSVPLTAVLLDTHVLVWLLAGNERLGAKARAARWMMRCPIAGQRSRKTPTDPERAGYCGT